MAAGQREGVAASSGSGTPLNRDARQLLGVQSTLHCRVDQSVGTGKPRLVPLVSLGIALPRRAVAGCPAEVKADASPRRNCSRKPGDCSGNCPDGDLPHKARSEAV